MSTPPRSSPRFRKEDQDAIHNNTGDGGAIRKDFQRLNINAEVYQPPHGQGNSGNEYLAAAVSSSLNLPNF